MQNLFPPFSTIAPQEPSGTPQQVALPKHLFAPFGAQSIDIRKSITLLPTQIQSVITFKGPAAGVCFFTHYSVYTDATNAAECLFIPTIQGSRILPFHGDPTDSFKINQSLGQDLTALAKIQLTLNPDETLNWTVRNLSGINTLVFGVRMIGYFFSQTLSPNQRLGG